MRTLLFCICLAVGLSAFAETPKAVTQSFAEQLRELVKLKEQRTVARLYTKLRHACENAAVEGQLNVRLPFKEHEAATVEQVASKLRDDGCEVIVTTPTTRTR